MTTRERHDDRELDTIVDAADREASADVDAAVAPGFAAIVARAHRIDPQAIGADAVERARRLPRSPSSTARVEPAARVEVEVDLVAACVAAMRAEAQDDVAAREAAGVPPWRVRARPSSVRVGVFAVCMVAAAAAVVLSLGLFERWRASQREAEREQSQALAGRAQDSTWREVEPAPTRLQPATPAPRPVTRVAPAPVPTPAAVLPELAPTTAIPRPRASKVPTESRLERLDREAQAALAAGDRSRADALYAEIIARGRRHPLVELAYGERFTLARALGATGQRELYTAYLASFPSGRFADDAHAGLCRTAAAEAKPACWQQYVDRFPAGAYRRHAERWLDVPAAP
ncbi:MAG: hypothetical protein K1X88_01800 [Nannocystaceae bacterium]|nr:hypothetical protein [Nannocystaceae bacterium]